MVYDDTGGRFSYSKKKVTDTKGNSRVNFPKEGGDVEDEAMMEMMRMELKGVFSQYCMEECMKGGAQKSNLNEAERRGLKSLKKRVNNSEIVIVPTDKSGRFAVMSLTTYELAGQAHTNKDEVVPFSIVKSTQTELNGHVSMLIKTFKIGEEWNHGDRMRETMINNSLAVCPLYLLYKDHKGWDRSKGPIPPTRPVASGNRGMNLHLSEILSDILEPVADEVKNSNEVISTEDMIARMLVKDRSLEDWHEGSWLEDVVYEGFSACMKCKGMEGYKFDKKNPELCKCGTSPLVQCEDVVNEERTNLGEGTKDLVKLNDQEEYTRTVRTSMNFMELLRQSTWSEITGDLKEGEFLDSKEVRNEMIQDYGAPMELIGFDVNALYPSLDWGNTEKVIRQSIIESGIEWDNLDIMEGCRYIALNWDANKCRQSSLARILPVRRAKTGVRPGLRGTGPLGPDIHDQEQWRFPDVVITDEERRDVIATVVSIAVKELFKNHLYTFGNKVFRQTSGGAIGLRATCAIARITMNVWDNLWGRKIRELNLRQELYTRYMDDGRSLIHPVRPGWRIADDGCLRFMKEWEQMDKDVSPTERTKRVLEGSMKSIMVGIEMTMETKEEFGGTWLPTLDVKLAVSKRNRIMFDYYEKPTCSNLTLQKDSAMEQNTKVGILANEVMRRMLNIGGDTNLKSRWDTLDDFAVKLLTSGFSLEQSRRIILSGIRGYEGKIQRRKLEMAPLYRTSEDSGASRAKKKILGKSTWFKGKKSGGKRTHTDLTRGGELGSGKGRKMGNTGPLETRTVLFVEHTPDGTLAKRLREQLGRMEQTMGFKMKVVERAGTRLKDLFSLTNVWGGSQCEREDCTTCTQEGEDLPDCTKRGIVYESICTKCNPGAAKPGPLKTINLDVPSVYVGESSRSIYERAGEHWNAFKKRNSDSHIWKHHLLHHRGEGEPEMLFKVVGTFRSALSRQIFEAVRIRRRGAMALNSRGEYDRCKIHRLTIEKEGEQHVLGEQRSEGTEGSNRDIGTEGERSLMDRRKEMDRENSNGTAKPSSRSQKRGNNDYLEDSRRPKKRKYALVGEQWGSQKGTSGLDCKLEHETTYEGGTKDVVRITGEKQDEAEVGTKGVVSTARLEHDVQVKEGEGSKDLVDTARLELNVQYEDEGGTKDVVRTYGVLQSGGSDLFDTAATVMMLREDRGDCNVRRGWCLRHNAVAKKITTNKQVWTKVKKTGLYKYCSRKLSVWRCVGDMATLVPTMGPRDGAGGNGQTRGGLLNEKAISKTQD